jgi:hypothetical protein
MLSPPIYGARQAVARLTCGFAQILIDVLLFWVMPPIPIGQARLSGSPTSLIRVESGRIVRLPSRWSSLAGGCSRRGGWDQGPGKVLSGGF